MKRIAVAIDRRNGPAVVTPSAAAHLLRANVTLVPQDAEVLEGTLAENLALCATHDGRADLRRSIRKRWMLRALPISFRPALRD